MGEHVETSAVGSETCRRCRKARVAMGEQPNVKAGETYWVRDESGNEELPALCERGVHGYRIWMMGHDEQYETLGEWTAIERIPTPAELAEQRAELERLRGQVERLSGQAHAIATLCGQVNGLRSLLQTAERERDDAYRSCDERGVALAKQREELEAARRELAEARARVRALPRYDVNMRDFELVSEDDVDGEHMNADDVIEAIGGGDGE